jgi:hypothetical protein
MKKNHILNQQGEQLAWKAKTKWYNEGEKSNKYFLNLLKSKNARNEMSSIRNNDQNITDPKVINHTVNEYYSKLYNGSKSTNEDDGSFLADLFTLDEAEANSINTPLTMQELWEALRPLKDSAPGPDGISHIYLKKLWDIIGPIILDAWNFSITTKTLPPSYTRSYLRLIPKAGKDTSLLKNWRPITLSNCDLKLITRVYNNRLIKILAKYISTTQTAYIKGRNITDNVRLINSAIQLSNREPQINGSIIALDAQKAFDSVSHGYLNLILNSVGLQSFTPIFKLLYKGLQNDLIINGEVVGNHKVTNGVKQGDALSCTLFILAMEPLLKRIEKNEAIKSIESVTLQYKWPKVVGYADDITCITTNEIACKQAIFNEYEKFTNIAGLKLNADKTEIFNFAGGLYNYSDPLTLTNVTYLGSNYEIVPVNEIKINGIIMSKNVERSKELNCDTLIQKMDKHFRQWSKRGLSLLGRIQIFKTFGLSQFLYHLATFEPTLINWKAIQTRINKFLWNKNYANNSAPSRIKKEIMYTPLKMGGFGMIDIKEVVTSLRLRRHFTLVKHHVHPLSELLSKLTEELGYLGTQPLLNIDEILNMNLKAISDKRKADCNAPVWQIESDLILHSNLLSANIIDMIRLRKRESTEYRKLQRMGMKTFSDILRNPRQSLAVFTKISERTLVNVITIMSRLYSRIPLPVPVLDAGDKLRDLCGRWVDSHVLPSRNLRELFFSPKVSHPKITQMSEIEKNVYFKKLSKIVSVVNKSRILRLLYGDVYCAERTFRWDLSESNLCKRCFEVETITHLLRDCTYTRKVYSLLGIDTDDINEIIGINLSRGELEIRVDFIGYLVFRQHTMPPEILVQTTLERYAKGLAGRGGSDKVAIAKLRRIS